MHTLQLIDRYMGIPFCGILSLLSGKRREKLPEEINSILVIKMMGLGSIVLMSPLLKSLRKCYPAARIDFLTMENHAEIAGMYGLVDRVYTVNFRSPGTFFTSNIKTIMEIRSLHYDVIIDAEFYSRYTSALSYLCRPKIIAGFHSRDIYRGNLRGIKVYFNQYRHMIDNFIELAVNLGAVGDDAVLSEPILDDFLDKKIREVLGASGIDPDRPYILLNPHVSNTSYYIDRSWPLEYFKKVGNYLNGTGYQVVVIDAPSRGDSTDWLVKSSGNKIKRLFRELSLIELMGLIKSAFLLITNDSGPLHMAVSVGTPTFSFFGTETPVLYGYRFFPHTCFYQGLACSPCLSVLNFKRGKCELGVRCMKEIKPGRVIEAFAKQEKQLRDYRAGKKDEEA